ncbi:MAG TPA: beta-ketoacyl-ACP synthase III [Vicinamibacteria bacterium]|nr:beta-ketoacyl-ACP synthase III [Vicinamibacteria bacterium]
MPSTTSPAPARRAAITSLGLYVPDRVVTNAELEKRVKTSDEWIRTRTGICERRYAEPGTPTSALATRAVRDCLERRGIGADELDLIVVATVTPDMLFPATACIIQDQIKATRAWGFDISAACSGFVYALATGAQFVQAGTHRKVMVVGADVMTSILDWTDRTTCVLFGDGAGAVLLEPSPDDTGILDFANEVEGSGGCYLYMPGGGSLHPPTHETVDKKMHYIRQEGPHVFKYAVRKFADSIAAILEKNRVPYADLDLLVPHQANVRIIDAARDRLGLPDAKVVKNIARYGNTTAATIPLALGTALDEGRLAPGDLILMAAVGAGFTVGTALVRWTGFPWK